MKSKSIIESETSITNADKNGIKESGCKEMKSKSIIESATSIINTDKNGIKESGCKEPEHNNN